MLFGKQEEKFFVVRTDVNDPLSAYSKHAFELDDAEWPSVEHYFQGMKFEDLELRESIRQADHPKVAMELAEANKKHTRKDWKRVEVVMMTRAVYTKCRTHDAVAEALLETGEVTIVETTMYDYFWGCGRDGRGHNHFGKVLMAVRDKLLEERSS